MTQRFLDSSVFHRPLGRDLPAIARAEGALLWDTEGRRYIDGSGGAVVVNVGHGRREIAAAMARQAETVGLRARHAVHERGAWRSTRAASPPTCPWRTPGSTSSPGAPRPTRPR